MLQVASVSGGAVSPVREILCQYSPESVKTLWILSCHLNVTRSVSVFFPSKSCLGIAEVLFSFPVKHTGEHICVVPHGPVNSVDVQQHRKHVHFVLSVELTAWTPGRNS